MPTYKPIINHIKKTKKRKFKCQCGNQLEISVGGFYESIEKDCVSCNQTIKLTKKEVEALEEI